MINLFDVLTIKLLLHVHPRRFSMLLDVQLSNKCCELKLVIISRYFIKRIDEFWQSNGYQQIKINKNKYCTTKFIEYVEISIRLDHQIKEYKRVERQIFNRTFSRSSSCCFERLEYFASIERRDVSDRSLRWFLILLLQQGHRIHGFELRWLRSAS